MVDNRFHHIDNQISKKMIFSMVFLAIVFLFKLELLKLGIVATDPARDLAIALGIAEG